MRLDPLSSSAFAGLLLLLSYPSYSNGSAAFTASRSAIYRPRTSRPRYWRTPAFPAVGKYRQNCRSRHGLLWATTSPGDAPAATTEATTTATSTVPPGDFIDTELRAAAMKLHTKKQAPKEGQAEEENPNAEPYVPTHDDYLAFLVDSQHVYQAFEDVVNTREDLAVFQNTGLERTKPLEQDIEFMVKEYNLVRPAVGEAGKFYADEIRRIGREGSVPEFICHYYNFYFAHTAGGRMIGKQMSALLLNKKTLEFYKWDGDLNEIKARVKNNIEAMAASWTREEKDECVAATAAAFRDGAGLNSYLMGGSPGH